jgi:tRNA-2-methylthio-N6-dimethylallyladenosine synthase
MNEHDSERLAGLMLADGLEETEDPESADVVILNTCCIRENADNRLYGTLGHLKSLKDKHPGMQIVVGGCLAQKDRELLRTRAPQVDVVFGTHNLASAPGLIRRSASSGPIVEILDEPIAGGDPAHASAISAVRDVPWSAWVTIQTGCDNSCAFCIVPSVRGREVSRPIEELVTEVRRLAQNGVTEVTLLGQNVNSYGRDLTRRRPMFAELLRAVGAVEGIKRVRFTSPHPKDIRPETIEAMSDTEAVVNQLHLPLQSGSNAVLKAMRRGYTSERYLARLRDAREGIDDLAVTTDLIVGFPGETDDDAERTLEVAAEAGFDSAYTFIFSPRPGTRAAEMKDAFVPPEVIADRFERLKVVLERSALARHRERVGREEEVLVEGTSKRDSSVLSGRTGQGKLVHFAGPLDTEITAGSYARVLVTSAAPHFLRGELLGVSQLHKHGIQEHGVPKQRVQIPVRVTGAVRIPTAGTAVGGPAVVA